MAKAARSDYVVLMDRSDEQKTGLKLMRDEAGALLYRWDLAPPILPEAEIGNFTYGQFRPEQELIWSVNDWSNGALKFYESRGQPGMYAIADKVWAATSNELGLGPLPEVVTFGLLNGAAQLGATTNWTASGVTLTAVTTAPYAGATHFQLASTSTNDYIHQSLENATRWRSNGLLVRAKVRGSAAGGQMRLQIVESGGSSTPTTSGTAVTLTTSYQTISANVTAQADSTGFNIRIQCSDDQGEDRTVYVDMVQAFSTDTSDSTAEGQNDGTARMGVTTQGLHAVTETAIYLFNEASDHWSLRKGFGASITGTVEVFDDRIFVPLGESTAYQYSDAADSTTWNTKGGSGTDDNANYFSKALNVNGNWALAKTLDDDNVHLATDPTASSAWGAAVEVGKDDHLITNVFTMNGTLGVGKEDGFYQYQTLVGNRFQNMYPGAEFAISANNFSRGITYNGMFYTVIAEVGMTRFDGTTWQDISHLLQSPGFDDFGNRVRALGTDGTNLYVLVEDLAAVSITKQCWVYMLKEFQDGSWAVHQISSLTISEANDMAVYKPSTANNQYLFINGEITTSEAVSYRLQLPDRTDTPRLATNKNMSTTGTLITSYMDFGHPNVDKSLDKFSLYSENLSGSRTVKVEYMVDNDTSWTVINSATSTFNGSPSGTMRFDEGVICKRFRIRLTLTGEATNSPVIKGFAVHLSWAPLRLKRWVLTASVEDNMRALQGVPYSLTAARQLIQLGVLRREISPLKIEDIDGESQRCRINGMEEAQVRVRTSEAGVSHYARGITLELIEVFDSAEGWGLSRWDEFEWS
jgi:hypothetical protein